MFQTDGFRYCDRCGVLLTPENNKCGYELCDECNEWLVDWTKEEKMRKGEKLKWDVAEEH